MNYSHLCLNVLIGMKKSKLYILFFVLLHIVVLSSCKSNTKSQEKIKIKTKIKTKKQFEWLNIHDGLDFCETNGPFKSIVNDSKISILKLNPEKFDFYLLSATEFGNKPKTVTEWADTFDLNIVINAGMYDLTKTLLSKAYMKNYNHTNNPDFNPSYNAVIAFNPINSSDSKFIINDITCNSWDSLKSDYHCFAQGMRMIDCNGEALNWNKKNQSCSMIVAASDDKGNIYYIFTRSPYTHNDIIKFLLSLPFHIKETIYLEGGPETSMYINIGNTKIRKIGSYVSTTFANDDNNHFWKLPNVIGVKAKK